MGVCIKYAAILLGLFVAAALCRIANADMADRPFVSYIVSNNPNIMVQDGVVVIDRHSNFYASDMSIERQSFRSSHYDFGQLHKHEVVYNNEDFQPDSLDYQDKHAATYVDDLYDGEIKEKDEQARPNQYSVRYSYHISSSYDMHHEHFLAMDLPEATGSGVVDDWSPTIVS